MGLDTKTYWLTDRQSQYDFDFDFDFDFDVDFDFDFAGVVERKAEWREASAVRIDCEL
jgi:hypothetical protein